MASYLSAYADIDSPKFSGHVWRDDGGAVNGTVDLGHGGSFYLCFDSPADARALAAACIACAEAMEAMEES